VRPFNKDFAIRGLLWADDCFPKKWFSNDKIDDEEKYLKVASVIDDRKERIRHGIYSFLELPRHRLPASLDTEDDDAEQRDPWPDTPQRSLGQSTGRLILPEESAIPPSSSKAEEVHPPPKTSSDLKSLPQALLLWICGIVANKGFQKLVVFLSLSSQPFRVVANPINALSFKSTTTRPLIENAAIAALLGSFYKGIVFLVRKK